MKRLISHICALCAALVVPSVAMAQAPSDFKSLVALFLNYIRLFLVLVFGLTFLMVIWGVMRAWIFGQGNAEKIEEGQQIAIWGVIGLVVMVGVWGIVTIIRTSLFGLSS